MPINEYWLVPEDEVGPGSRQEVAGGGEKSDRPYSITSRDLVNVPHLQIPWAVPYLESVDAVQDTNEQG